MEGINGLKAVGDHLYIAGGKNLLKADSKKGLAMVILYSRAGQVISLMYMLMAEMMFY